MTKLIIESSDVNDEYLEELNEIIKIRKARRIIYNDSFLQEKSESILSIIDGKRRRFDSLNLLSIKSKVIRDKIYDDLRDVVNYYIFLLCILKKENENEKYML